MVNLSEAERSRVKNSSLIINGKLGKLRDFESKGADFARLLTDEGQAYFDRTRYISVLDRFKKTHLVFPPSPVWKIVNGEYVGALPWLPVRGRSSIVLPGSQLLIN
jgi:hypothetical protein